MKPLFLPIILLAGSIAASGQTWIRFDNTPNTSVYNPYAPGPVAAGDTFKVGLYVALNDETDPDRFTLLATTNFYAPGLFDGGPVAVPGPMTARYVRCQVRVWESAFGSTWEQAVHADARNGLLALRGASRIFDFYVMAVPPVPGALPSYGLQAFSVTYAPRASSIDAFDSYAWGANFGWMDWYPDPENGATIGEYVCSGYIYAANLGWIHLGDGTPANGISYNEFNGDPGVNVGGNGDLHGVAWGANIGWVNFTTNGYPAQAPRVDLRTGKFSGYAWGANVGWISLSNAVACVRTDRIVMGGDSDSDGIADAWEREQTGDLTSLSREGDRDGDGVTDLREYFANTHPLDPSSNLILGSSPVSGVGPSPMVINWVAMPGRVYRVEFRNDLNPSTPWVDSGLISNPALVSGVGPSPMRAVFGVGPSPLYQLFGVGPSPMHEAFGVGPSPLRVYQVRALRPADIVGTPSP